MPERPLSVEELRELCVELAEALSCFVGELEGGLIDYPLPDDIARQLAERAALAAALKAAPEEIAGKLRTVYLRELDGVSIETEPSITIDLSIPGATERAAEAFETLRRAGYRDHAMRVALERSREWIA